MPSGVPHVPAQARHSAFAERGYQTATYGRQGLGRWNDPGRSCLHCTIQHYVTNETDSENAGAVLPCQIQRARTGLYI
jgi:hypothetical protein